MNKFTHDAVVVDIGETHIRIAVADPDRLAIDHYVQFASDTFASPELAVDAYLRSLPSSPATLAIVMANGDLQRRNELERKFTNRPAGTWNRVQIIDQLVAVALILPDLFPHDVESLGGMDADTRATKAVVSVSSELRVGTLTQADGRWIASNFHAGCISFAPQTQDELDIVERIRCDAGHVSVEHLLSDAGLAHLYEILLESSGQPVRALPAAEIVIAGLHGDDRCATTAIRHFTTWLGRFAGDMALLYEAGGGVYLWGPLLRTLETILHNEVFRRAFEAKGRRSNWLSQIPVSLIRSEDAVLRGAAKALNQNIS
ncbi:MAG: glucokinase [Sinorhizobium meliloti]|nr:glucokinase [Sinorhizobium meliloti]